MRSGTPRQRAIATALLVASGFGVTTITPTAICVDVLGIELFCPDEPAATPTPAPTSPPAQPEPTPTPTSPPTPEEPTATPDPVPAPAPAPIQQPEPKPAAGPAPAALDALRRAPVSLAAPIPTVAPSARPEAAPAPSSSPVAPPRADVAAVPARTESDAPLAFGAVTLTGAGVLGLATLVVGKNRWLATVRPRGRHAAGRD